MTEKTCLKTCGNGLKSARAQHSWIIFLWAKNGLKKYNLNCSKSRTKADSCFSGALGKEMKPDAELVTLILKKYGNSMHLYNKSSRYFFPSLLNPNLWAHGHVFTMLELAFAWADAMTVFAKVNFSWITVGSQGSRSFMYMGTAQGVKTVIQIQILFSSTYLKIVWNPDVAEFWFYP